MVIRCADDDVFTKRVNWTLYNFQKRPMEKQHVDRVSKYFKYNCEYLGILRSMRLQSGAGYHRYRTA